MIYSDKRGGKKGLGYSDRRIKICSSNFIPADSDIKKLEEALKDYNYEILKHGVYAPIYNFNGSRIQPSYTLHFEKINKDL